MVTNRGKSWPPAPGTWPWVSPSAPTSRPAPRPRPAPPSWPAPTRVPVFSALTFLPKTIFERNWWFGRLHHNADRACHLLGRGRVLGEDIIITQLQETAPPHPLRASHHHWSRSCLIFWNPKLKIVWWQVLEGRKIPKTRTDKCPLIVAEVKITKHHRLCWGTYLELALSLNLDKLNLKITNSKIAQNFFVLWKKAYF